MKKIKKKLSEILKVFLALSLLFNNLMPLSVVFADELENNDDNKVVDVGEGESNLGDGEVAVGDETGEGDLLGEEEPGEEPGGEEPVGEEPTSEVALTYEVYVDDQAFQDDYGSVELSKDVQKLDIIAKLSGTEATEGYTFTLGDATYTTEELLNGVIVKSLTFSGYLYGGFNLEIDGTLTDPEGTDTEYYMNYVVEYGTDTDNDDALSAINSDYVFANYVVTSTNYDEETILAIAGEAFPNADASIEDDGLLLTDDHDVTIWYGIVTTGDVNGDGKINEDDLKLLIDQILGLEEPTEASDVNGDGEVNDDDAVYLKMLLELGFAEEITEEDATIRAKFGEFSNPVKVGDEFTLEYIVTLSEYTINGISGLITYDKNLLELVSAEAKVFDLGGMNEDQILYLGEYLDLDIEPEVDDEGNVVLDDDGYPIIKFNDTDYVLLTLNFKALAAGETSVLMDDVKYYQDTYYLTAEGDTSIDVTIEENDEEQDEEEESPFTSIVVSGYDVDLSTYEVSVPNDVTAIDLAYVLADEGSSVISVAAPEELAEGENTIVLTVKDANGEEKTYTIKVTREAAKTEETTVAAVNYTEPTYDDDNDDDDTTGATPSDAITDETNNKDNGKLSRIVIIILILLAIAGLIYLIFKDDLDDEETKKANRDIDKMKKEDDKKRKLDDDKKVKKKGR